MCVRAYVCLSVCLCVCLSVELVMKMGIKIPYFTVLCADIFLSVTLPSSETCLFWLTQTIAVDVEDKPTKPLRVQKDRYGGQN